MSVQNKKFRYDTVYTKTIPVP